jgi:hypothetical protein
MSDDRAAMPSAAEAMFPHLARGEDGSLGEDGASTARRVQQEGIARPPAETPARPLFSSDQARPSPATPPANDRMFDAARYQAPDGQPVDPALMSEFGATAKDLGLRQSQGEQLLALHRKALDAQNARHEQARADWLATTERDFGADLPRVVDDIKHAVGNDADAQRFYQMLEWSGLAVEPAVLRVLRKLARGW